MGGLYTYAGAKNAQIDTKSYTLLDLQAHYDLEQWRFLATVSNAGGKEYIATCQSAAW